MPRYKLRTLLILLAVRPPVVAGVWSVTKTAFLVVVDASISLVAIPAGASERWPLPPGEIDPLADFLEADTPDD